MLREASTERRDPPEDGQHDGTDVHQQTRGHSIPRTEPINERANDMVHGEEYYPPSLPPGGSTQCDSRYRVLSHEGPIGLDAPPTCVQRTQQEIRSNAGRPVCFTAHKSTGAVCELEAGPRGNGNRCLLNRLDTVPTSIREPTVEPSLTTVREQQTRLVVITPVWVKQTWYLVLLSMLTKVPLLLPQLPDLIQATHRVRNQPTISSMDYLRNNFRWNRSVRTFATSITSPETGSVFC